MKRYRMLTVIALGLAFAPWSRPADSALESQAARRELEDFVRSTNNRLRDLEESLLAQQKRISSLEDENRRLRGDVAQAHNKKDDNAAVDTALKRLAEDIKEVDKNRLADNKLILEKLGRLADEKANTIKKNQATAPPKPSIPTGADVFEYKIQSGDNLSKIVPKLKAQGINVSAEDIQKANPTVVWTKLKIGQSILIPDVK